MLIAVVSFSSPCAWAAGGSCANGVAVPPFLATSSTPNLLIMIDNSSSMYDLAYINESNPAGCYDDTYQSIESYAGYFDPAKWYSYNFVSAKFEPIADADVAAIKSSATYTSYITNDPADAADDSSEEDALIQIDATPAVTDFTAKGNFLNWATASKLDVEKKILTGGKYDPVHGAVLMESRGCLNRRMIKKIAVKDSGGSDFFLTLGIIPPGEKKYNSWENGIVYAAGSIVSDSGVNLYITAAGGTSIGTGVADDTGVTDWTLYTLTRWTNGAIYPAGSIVTDPSKLNTLDEGTLYITKTGGTANGTGVADDIGITDWTTYNTTHIEIFPFTATGFDNTACQLAIEEMGKESPNQGLLKQYIEDCLGYVQGSNVGDISNYMAAFNHSIHNCWYASKHASWPPGAGPVESIKPACEALYDSGTDPWEITTDSRGYACYGVYNADPALRDGYVGRCWIPAPGAVLTCTKTHPVTLACMKWEWVGGVGSGSWESDACIEAALQDYCGVVEIPEVIDPTDQAGETGEFWNLPAVLIDSGVVAQIGEPLAVLKGHVHAPAPPEGMLKEFADDIRMGVMVFNDNGSKSECDPSLDPHILYECHAKNRDGGKVVAYIDQGAVHANTLIAAINNIKANSWTPMAEAYYTAMKYYTQSNINLLNRDLPDFILNPDFRMDAAHPDPINDPCQPNNILLITDGASTADLATDVQAFVTIAGQDDGDAADVAGCPDSALSASTHMDDLAYYLFHEKKIRTHVVVAGTPRSIGTDECSPDVQLADTAANGGTTLNTAANMAELEDKLRETFDIIRAGAAAGSAASVISSSRGGEGAIYQAIFWPEIDLPETADPVVWAGEVHAMFIDTYGMMYEDTNGNRTLDDSDEPVVIYFDDAAEITKACYGMLNADGTCNGTSTDIRQVKYLWSVTDWLSGITDTDVLVNRTSAKYISEEKKRYIFTWNDLDNDGIVDSNEQIPFEERDWAALATSGGRGPVPLDFGMQSSADVNNIVKWMRGMDQAGMRNRRLLYDFNMDGTESLFTWRLGDVVHSTPVSSASPAEGYHLLYRDASYGNFVSQYQKRRHVIYFGSNDGMLHAVNGGFFKAAEKKFLKTPDGTSEDTAPELGAELWAYVPYNLLPHLRCLAEPAYEHKYYVDNRPRLFDVKIFNDDTDHPGGWGTILVGSMRFGGAPVDANQLDLDGNGVFDYPADTRRFTSAYFILDVTNPESPPVLLGELTMNGSEINMGYTTSIPTVVPMKDGDIYKWYLVLGSGPTDSEGASIQNLKVAVLPLELLTSATPSAFRIPNVAPAAANNYVGSWTAPAANSFASDMITVDFETKENYRADVVYFGSVEGSYATSWTGKLYRLITRKLDVSGSQITSTPDEWFFTTLINVEDPVTAAPAVGWDGVNYWVCFGTGRFFHAKEKLAIDQQAYYGIKEPLNCNKEFTWATVEKTGTPDSLPGSQGLLQVDKILIQPSGASAADIVCKDLDPDCLALVAGGVTTFNDLEEYISGSGCLLADPTGTDGWYREFPYNKERNLGQGALLGGLLTFTTFKPFDDPCLTEGYSFLYGIYLKTGTSWYKPVFQTIIGNEGLDVDGNIIDIVPLGRGMSTTPNLHVGKSEGSKAFIQTSTGAIIEIPQVNLPMDTVKTGRANWIELSK